MRILDLDLDFFLDSKANGINLTSGLRLESEYYKPDSKEAVREFLTTKCGLNSNSKVNGCLYTHHDEVFYDIRSKIESGIITEPFDIDHIDAHADLGLGDCTHVYVMTELIHEIPSQRLYPRESEINPGNFLLYLVISRWVANLTYVYHPDTYHMDFPHSLFRGGVGASCILEVKKYSKGTDVTNRKNEPVGIDEPIIINSVSRVDFNAAGAYDFVYLTQSPEFTPIESDELISVFEEFIVFESRTE
ncbi:conserved protein of unknown function [Petrocella atlantisensis]|uniref:Uncharacterized protein n=1 Tax=Petrocella atlantisensis TaxID=2173034 RepID=A0A3P7S2S3_9FIRM|nr:UPF0489 family protein [Petrocella atlantisensis]VDN47059.1 conserved protein of unknown function [Petrocella atlantisensis]